MNAEEIKKLLAEARGKLTLFKFHTTAGQENNVKKGKNLRRTIARLLTALRAKI